MFRTPEYAVALQKAMYLLRRKFYSEWEMRAKLKKNDLAGEVIDEVVEHLKNSGYLNDYKLCHALFAKYSEDKKCGSHLAVSKILQRGLPKAIVAEVRKEYDFANETEQAFALAKKRCQFEKSPTSAEFRKVARYLASRGFSASAISKTLQLLKKEEILAAEEEN